MNPIQTNTILFNGNTPIKRGFSKFSRKLLFWLIFLINLFNHLDHGAIAASTTFLMTELTLDHSALGIIGSLVYLGLTIGACCAGAIFNSYTPKWIVSISILLSCVFLYYLTTSQTMLGLSISRICCGFFQVFSMIYFPVWVDAFGDFEQRTIWLSYLQLGPALGTMLGYAIEAIGIRKFNNWRYGFYFQCIALISTTALFLLSPDKFFSRNYKRTDLTRELVNERENEIENAQSLNEILNKLKVINGNKYNRLSDFSIFELHDEEEQSNTFNYIKTLRSLWYNNTYFYTLTGICCLLFIITGIEFWITNYMEVVLHQDVDKVYITFAIVCITAPTLGVLLGGYIIEKLGGYASRQAPIICFYCGVAAGCCGIPLPLIDSCSLFTTLMWFTLFFGGFIMPGLTGILLFSIDESCKEESNSITHFCYNFLGYLPAPALYGAVCDLTGGKESRWGLKILMAFTVVGIYCFKKAKDKQREKDKRLEEAPLRGASFSRRSIVLSELYGTSQKNYD